AGSRITLSMARAASSGSPAAGFARSAWASGWRPATTSSAAASLPATSACRAKRSGYRSTRSQTWRPIEPVAPSSARRRSDGRDFISLGKTRGSRGSLHRLASGQVQRRHVIVHDHADQQERINSVEQPAVTGNQLTGILDAGGALDL